MPVHEMKIQRPLHEEFFELNLSLQEEHEDPADQLNTDEGR